MGQLGRNFVLENRTHLGLADGPRLMFPLALEG